MAEADLASYQLQLQQVEAALLADPDSSELQKLKDDLVQVIDLTRELITAAEPEAEEEEVELPAPSGPSRAAAAPTPSSSTSHQEQPVKHWQVGEECQALWPKDGLYHEAQITEIFSSDNTAKVMFTKWTNQFATATLASLRLSDLGYTGSATSADKKAKLAAQREYLKKKKAKKAERYKAMEEKTEQQKSSWQNFATKGAGKKGFVKKSIFKTPENSTGRVGVGTCGVGGQKMTEFKMAGNKYRRN